MPHHAAPDQGLHCLQIGLSIKKLNKMKNTRKILLYTPKIEGGLSELIRMVGSTHHISAMS